MIEIGACASGRGLSVPDGQQDKTGSACAADSAATNSVVV